MGRQTRTQHRFVDFLLSPCLLGCGQPEGFLALAHNTFYRWYARYLEAGYEGVKNYSPQPMQFWNLIPDKIREQVVQIALAHPALSSRELACHITDTVNMTPEFGIS